MFSKQIFLSVCVLCSMFFAWPVFADDACEAGKYWDYDNSECVLCPVGYSCSGNTDPEKCVGDTPFSSENRTQCVACDGPTEYKEDGVCKTCPNGQYAFIVNFNKVCGICGEGRMPNDTLTGCTACNESNQYQKDGLCYTCKAGYYINDNNECVRCVASGNNVCLGTKDFTDCGDKIPNSERSACVACDGLTEYDDNGICKTCPNGKYANSNHDGCVSCGQGYYMKDGVCTICPAGSYCPGNGRVVKCSGASITDEEGQAECYVCSTGTYVNETHTQCVECSGISEYLSNNVCKQCDSGKFANQNNTDCITCGAGHYMNNGECLSCPAGYACSGDGTKQECEDGKYVNSDATACVNKCDSGSYLDNNAKNCKLCPAGFYCTNNEKNVCSGQTYSGAGAGRCKDCAGGHMVNQSHTKCVIPNELQFDIGNGVKVSLPLEFGTINTEVLGE